MLSEFDDYVRKNKLFSKKDKLLLAISGGIDSICLFHLLIKFKYKFSIAHCNFQLRGEDSDGDETFVKTLAEKYKIQCFSMKFDTLSESIKLKKSIQETARNLRYQWFENIRTTEAFNYILTAHHLSDNTETILINMLRSTGVPGLHGIPIKQNFIVRPLMYAKRENIIQYVTENKLHFRHDDSNDTNDYLRNRIRHQLIPALKLFDLNIDLIFSNIASKVLEYESFNENILDIIKKRHIRKIKNGFYIKDSIFKGIKYPDLLLYYLLKSYGFNRQSTKAYKNLDEIKLGAKLISKEWILTRERDGISLLKKDSLKKFSLIINHINDKFSNDLFEVSIKQIHSNKIDFNKKNTVFLDATKCLFPLKIRPWIAGDIMQPLGMKGRKKISDILTDNKILQSERKNQVVLTDCNEVILALLPNICSEKYKILPGTKTALAVCFKTL